MQHWSSHKRQRSPPVAGVAVSGSPSVRGRALVSDNMTTTLRHRCPIRASGTAGMCHVVCSCGITAPNLPNMYTQPEKEPKGKWSGKVHKNHKLVSWEQSFRTVHQFPRRRATDTDWQCLLKSLTGYIYDWATPTKPYLNHIFQVISLLTFGIENGLAEEPRTLTERNDSRDSNVFWFIEAKTAVWSPKPKSANHQWSQLSGVGTISGVVSHYVLQR